MLARLHRRYDALPEPRRSVVGFAVALGLLAAAAQPWSRHAVLASVAVAAALLASRIRHEHGW
jgi:hypothetical protein